MLVVAIRIVFVIPIVCLVLLHRNGSHDVESQVELPFALGQEVVAHRTLETPIVVEILDVGDFVVAIPGMLYPESNILEVDQNDESLLLALVIAHGTSVATTRSQTPCTPLVGFLSALVGIGIDGLPVNELIRVTDTLVSHAVVAQPIVSVLISNEAGVNGGSIRKGQYPKQAGLGRHGIYYCHNQK